MYAHIMSLRAPSTPAVGSKVKKVLFLKEVMMPIELMGMEHRAPCKHMFCPNAHPRPWIGSKGQNIFLLKKFMLHIKYKGMEHRALCKQILYPYTHLCPWGEVKRLQHLFSESCHAAYQSIGNEE